MNRLPGGQFELTPQEMARYDRHIIVPEIGLSGQKRLATSKVLVIGAGGLGSPVIYYLAAAGVGLLGIADFDTVDLSNLQRQILFDTDDVGSPKVAVAGQRARKLNPNLEVMTHADKLSSANITEVITPYDVVVDGTDNFSTRYLVNDACVLAGKPNISGAIYRFEGQASVFGGGGPCYRCLYPQPPSGDAVPNCAEAGVLGVMAGVIGSIQAAECLKLLLGIGSSLSGKLLLFDALSMRFDTLSFERNADCPVCGNNPRIKKVMEAAVSCQMASEDAPHSVTAGQLRDEIASGKSILLIDVRTADEYQLYQIESARHIPLAELPARYVEIGKDSDIVVYCKSGARSRRALEILFELGFQRLRNLQGGVLAWRQEVDKG